MPAPTQEPPKYLMKEALLVGDSGKAEIHLPQHLPDNRRSVQMNLHKLLKLLLTWLQKTSGMHLEPCCISQITTKYYGGMQGATQSRAASEDPC